MKAKFGFGGGTPPPPSISYRTHRIETTNGTSFSFSSVDIGDEPASGETRHVIIGISAVANTGSAPTYPSVTIGGISATEVVSQAAAIRQRVSLYIAEVPTGATATIAFTSSALANNANVAVWAAYNLVSASAVDTASSASDPATLDMNVLDGDVMVGFTGANSSADPTVTWTGMTERFDATVEFIGFQRASGADHTATADETPRSISANFSSITGTPSWCIAVAAAFR